MRHVDHPIYVDRSVGPRRRVGVCPTFPDRNSIHKPTQLSRQIERTVADIEVAGTGRKVNVRPAGRGAHAPTVYFQIAAGYDEGSGSQCPGAIADCDLTI